MGVISTTVLMTALVRVLVYEKSVITTVYLDTSGEMTCVSFDFVCKAQPKRVGSQVIRYSAFAETTSFHNLVKYMHLS